MIYIYIYIFETHTFITSSIVWQKNKHFT